MASTKLTLQIGILPLLIGLAKSFETKIGFKQGFEGKPLKTIRVVSDAESPRIPKEIKKIVQYEEIEKLYDAGDRYVPISNDIIKKATKQSSDIMEIMRIIPANAFPMHILDGSHYYVEIQKNKQKKIPDDAKVVYTMLYNYLKDNVKVMLVNYTTRGSTKSAVVFPSDTGLRLANIIPTNLQRAHEGNYLFDGEITPQHMAMFNTLVANYEQIEIDHEQMIDTSYEDTVATIEKILAGEEIPDEEVKVATPQPKMGLLDLLAKASEK